jgi:hypothetical protein
VLGFAVEPHDCSLSVGRDIPGRDTKNTEATPSQLACKPGGCRDERCQVGYESTGERIPYDRGGHGSAWSIVEVVTEYRGCLFARDEPLADVQRW